MPPTICNLREVDVVNDALYSGGPVLNFALAIIFKAKYLTVDCYRFLSDHRTSKLHYLRH